MKKIALTTLLLAFVLHAMAKFEPNTKWPYLYENFTDGVVYATDMTKSEGKLNVHLSGNVLHYIGKDGKVYQSTDKNVARVEIGADAYLFIDHSLMQVVGTEGNNVLLKYTKAEFSRIQSGNAGAYGADLNSSSAQQLSSLELGGMNTPELGKMLQEKNDGAEIPLSVEYFFIIDGKRIAADKRSVGDSLGEAKATAWKTFQKENKIKWKKEDSLLTILKFLSEQK